MTNYLGALEFAMPGNNLNSTISTLQAEAGQVALALEAVNPVPPQATDLWITDTLIAGNVARTTESVYGPCIQEMTTAAKTVVTTFNGTLLQTALPTGTGKLQMGDVTAGLPQICTTRSPDGLALLGGMFVHVQNITTDGFLVDFSAAHYISFGYDVDFSAHPLNPYGTDAATQAGFTCSLTNYSHGAITLTTSDGLQFQSSDQPLGTSYKILPYLTVRLTVIYDVDTLTHVWLVSN